MRVCVFSNREEDLAETLRMMLFFPVTMGKLEETGNVGHHFKMRMGYRGDDTTLHNAMLLCRDSKIPVYVRYTHARG